METQLVQNVQIQFKKEIWAYKHGFSCFLTWLRHTKWLTLFLFQILRHRWATNKDAIGAECKNTIQKEIWGSPTSHLPVPSRHCISVASTAKAKLFSAPPGAPDNEPGTESEVYDQAWVPLHFQALPALEHNLQPIGARTSSRFLWMNAGLIEISCFVTSHKLPNCHRGS